MTTYLFSVTDAGNSYYDTVTTGDYGWINVAQAQRIVESRQPKSARVYYQGTR